MVFTGQIREGARSLGGDELVKRVGEENEVAQNAAVTIFPLLVYSQWEVNAFREAEAAK
jgi:hypothetical protein